MSYSYNQSSLETVRGPIDGRRFFSKSPVHSASFIYLTAICMAGVLYGIYLPIQHPAFGEKRFLFVFICTGFAYSWWAMVLNLNRVRDSQRGVEPESVAPGSPLDVALGAAAWGAMQPLGYSATAMLMMEIIIGRLLTQAGL